MKTKILLLSLLTLITGSLYAGGLEYSQIIKVSDSPQTVPAGKVWKVMSFMQTASYTTSTNSSTCTSSGRISPFVVDGNNYYAHEVEYGSGSVYMAPNNDLPMWLPAGTVVHTVCAQHFLSIIEFTEVP